MVIFEKSHLFFQFQPFLEIEFSQVLSIQLHEWDYQIFIGNDYPGPN